MNPATLEESIVSAMAQIVYSQDVDIKLSIFKDALLNCENSKTVIRRVNKPIQPKWFNETIKSEIKIRNTHKVSGKLDLFRKQ